VRRSKSIKIRLSGTLPQSKLKFSFLITFEQKMADHSKANLKRNFLFFLKVFSRFRFFFNDSSANWDIYFLIHAYPVCMKSESRVYLFPCSCLSSMYEIWVTAGSAWGNTKCFFVKKPLMGITQSMLSVYNQHWPCNWVLSRRASGVPQV